MPVNRSEMGQEAIAADTQPLYRSPEFEYKRNHIHFSFYIFGLSRHIMY